MLCSDINASLQYNSEDVVILQSCYTYPCNTTVFLVGLFPTTIMFCGCVRLSRPR